MPKQKTTTKSANPVHHFRKMDEKIKLLIGLGLGLLAILVFLKTPYAQNTLGIKIAGLSSSANYDDESADNVESEKSSDYGSESENDFEAQCNETACEDSRIQISAPEMDSRITTRKTEVIRWSEDESIESRWHTITIEGMGCGNHCPKPYVITSKYRGVGYYKWSIGSFLPVPDYYQNKPVWLRVATQGRYENGVAKNYFGQTSVVLTTTR